MTIGERIKQRREELGLTQDELAHKLGYKSRSSINKIELNLYNLKQSKIKAIADALETTPSFIMGWDEESNVELIQKQVNAAELFEQSFGKDALIAVNLFLNLDAADQGRIIERMSTMLEAKKYSVQDGLRNA